MKKRRFSLLHLREFALKWHIFSPFVKVKTVDALGMLRCLAVRGNQRIIAAGVATSRVDKKLLRSSSVYI